MFFFLLKGEAGIGVLVRSRGRGDVYKRQEWQVTVGVEPKRGGAGGGGCRGAGCGGGGGGSF